MVNLRVMLDSEILAPRYGGPYDPTIDSHIMIMIDFGITLQLLPIVIIDLGLYILQFGSHICICYFEATWSQSRAVLCPTQIEQDIGRKAISGGINQDPKINHDCKVVK